MKQVQMRKEDYDDLVYPSIALATNTTETDLVTQLATRTKMEVAGHPIPSERMQPVLCERCQSLTLHEPKKRPPDLYEMTDDTASFLFEDPEAAYMVEKLIAQLPHLHGNVSFRLIPILNALRKKISEMDAIGIVTAARVAGQLEPGDPTGAIESGGDQDTEEVEI